MFSRASPFGRGCLKILDLEGNSKARAYAWSSPIEGSPKRRFFAVLQLDGVRSPLDAVRSASAEEQPRTYTTVRTYFLASLVTARAQRGTP